MKQLQQKTRSSRVFTLLMFALLASPVFSAGKDHPLLSGMPSFTVNDQSETPFGRYLESTQFQCGPSRACNASDPGFDASGQLVVEGKVTKLHYVGKGNGGTLTVLRNYENAVKSIGGRRLTASQEPIGDHVFLVEQGAARTWVVLNNYTDDSYFLVFIEQKAMQQVVTAGQLADAINKQGFATLYINFDNNSAVVKGEARPAIDEVAALLAKDKSLRLSIEGHTDNVGNAAANKTLSQARAASVLKSLVEGKVDAKRLQSTGFGSEVPIADNRSDEGKAKNRRVELVKLK